MQMIKHGFITPKQINRFRYHAWPTVISLPDGTLFAAWSGDRMKHVCPFGRVVASRSLDGGYTWSPYYTVLDTPLDDRDAGLCLVGNRLLLTSFNNTRNDQRSYYNSPKHAPENQAEYELIEAYLNGITDAEEENYFGSIISLSDDNGNTFSTPTKAEVSCPHGPVLLPCGELLYAGTYFPTDLHVPKHPNGIYAVRLDRDGRQIGGLQTIALPQTETTGYYEPHVAVMPNGDVLCAIRVEDKSVTVTDANGVTDTLRTVYLCRSTDGGRTFSDATPTGWIGLPPHMYIRHNSEVVMTYSRRTKPFGIRARISCDNGYTWGEEMVLREDGVDWDLGYPSTTENRNGELVTVYYMKDHPSRRENRIAYTVWKL